MKIGTTEIQKVYLGTTELEGLYIGTNQAYKPSSGGIDEHTVLMCHFDESLDDVSQSQATSYIYSGPATYVDGKFGKALNHNQYVEYTSDNFNNLTNSTGVFTIDFWMKKTDFSGGSLRFGNSGGSSFLTLERAISGDTLTAGDLSIDISDITADSWFHFAWVKTGEKDGNYYKYDAYVNGVYKGYYKSSKTLTAAKFRASDKYIDELRISDNVRYTGNFTPPTQPYS